MLPFDTAQGRPFDPDFDDARWTLEWAKTPILQVPTGRHPEGYAVIERRLTQAQIFDRMYTASAPFPVRALLDPQGRLWMSDTPQERMMMFNNAMVSHGHILIGGLGLALYPQYAAARARRFTVVEHSPAVRDIVGPTLDRALTDRGTPIPFEIVKTGIEEFLSAPPSERYDTVFLDTWDTLDAANLPEINELRDLAVRHLAPHGRVLLWGYRWMVQLFEDAARTLLNVSPAQRQTWLAQFNPSRTALLQPVVDHLRHVRRARPGASHDAALLKWCREYIVSAKPTVTRSSESRPSGRDGSGSDS